MARVSAQLVFIVFGSILIQGCSSSPIKTDSDLNGKLVAQLGDPKQALDTLCQPMPKGLEISGNVWLRLQKASGLIRLPATVILKSPNELDMEVSNPLGGTEAQVKVRGATAQVVLPSKKQNVEKKDYWASIPLRWAIPLFMGQIPCPAPTGIQSAQYDNTEQYVLLIQANDGLYRYSLKEEDGLWEVSDLHWSTQDHWAKFNFEDRRGTRRAFWKWSVEGSSGGVKVQWKDQIEEVKKN